MEDYEKNLILLGKAAGMNLMSGAKHSTARDFRIQLPKSNKENAQPRQQQADYHRHQVG